MLKNEQMKEPASRRTLTIALFMVFLFGVAIISTRLSNRAAQIVGAMLMILGLAAYTRFLIREGATPFQALAISIFLFLVIGVFTFLSR